MVIFLNKAMVGEDEERVKKNKSGVGGWVPVFQSSGWVWTMWGGER
jgi:hypothetical protein